MNKEIKYIPGDLVIYASLIKEPVAEICEVHETSYTIKFMHGNFVKVTSKEIKPIIITPEILQKNGWVKEVMSRGVKNSHLVYTKPDIEEYGYFPIYIEKGIGDEFDVYPFTDNNVCTQIAYIKYVHQLQHLLFGLGINHEMEV